jgi:hypothetical protein
MNLERNLRATNDAEQESPEVARKLDESELQTELERLDLEITINELKVTQSKAKQEAVRRQLDALRKSLN